MMDRRHISMFMVVLLVAGKSLGGSDDGPQQQIDHQTSSISIASLVVMITLS